MGIWREAPTNTAQLCKFRPFALFEPVVTQTHLDSVELRISHPQIGVRDVPPAASNVHGAPLRCDDLNSAAAPRREVEVRGVSSWKIHIAAHTPARQLDVRRDSPGAQTGVPAQDDRFKAAAMYLLGCEVNE